MVTRKSAKAGALAKQTQLDDKRYCAIVFIGGGSSWAWGAGPPDEVAKRAAKLAKSDWSALFKFEKKQPFRVVVFDMKDHSGWYADAPGQVKSRDTNERLTPVATVNVTV